MGLETERLFVETTHLASGAAGSSVASISSIRATDASCVLVPRRDLRLSVPAQVHERFQGSRPVAGETHEMETRS